MGISVTENDRIKRYVATASQTDFVYDFPILEGESCAVRQNGTALVYGVDYTVSDIGEAAGGTVTLVVGATLDDEIIVYGDTPIARVDYYAGTTVDVSSANSSEEKIEFQIQQLNRFAGYTLRNTIEDGDIDELPAVDDRKNNLASWNSSGDLSYEDPITGVLSEYLRKDQNLSDVDSASTSRTNLGLGNSATKDTGTINGTVAVGDDSRFLTSGQKGALTGGVSVDASTLHTHSNLIPTSEKGVANGVATLNDVGEITASQMPSGVVTSAATGSTDDEIVVFNSTSGTNIKNSSKFMPSGEIVGTTDTQTLTNKTIDADDNTISDLTLSNLKAGVLDTDLTSTSSSDDTIPSAKATKTYADTKAGSVSNIGIGVGIGKDVLSGDLKLKTLKGGSSVTITSDSDSVTINSTGGGTGGIASFTNIGTGDGEVYKQITGGSTVELRTIKAGTGVTVINNADDITLSTSGAYLEIANNLSDLADVATARTNLGLGTIATQDSDSVSISGGSITGITDLAIADGGTGSSTAADARTALDVYSKGEVDTLDGAFLVKANNLSDVVDAATSRTNLGLGTIATQDADSVSITGGSVTGITDLAVADGGTGASDASGARTNLGLGTISTQDASSVSITGGSVTGITDLAIADGGTGASTQTVAFDNLSPTTTKGDVIVHNGSDNIRIAVGTNDQVLVSDSAEASGVKWADAEGGSGHLTEISSVTISSTVNSVDFTSIGSYKLYKLQFTGMTTTVSGSYPSVIFRNVATWRTVAATYTNSGFGYWDSTLVQQSGNNIVNHGVYALPRINSDEYWSGSVYITQLQEAATRTAVYGGSTGQLYATNNFLNFVPGGWYKTEEAHNGIRFACDNMNAGVVTLYGVK